MLRARLAAAMVGSLAILLAFAPLSGAEDCSQPVPGVRMGECAPQSSSEANSGDGGTQSGPVADDAAAARLLELANRERAAHGLPALTSREDVRSQAAGWSAHMAQTGTLAHNDAYFTDSNRRHLNATALGENVAYNHDVDDAHRRLMASPGHRANLLDGRFTVAGFAVVREASGRYWITQDFVAPAGNPAPAPPAPAPTPSPAPAPAAPAPQPASAAPAPAAAPSGDADATPAPAVTPAATPSTDDGAVPAAPLEVAADADTVELALGPGGSGAAPPTGNDAGAGVRLAGSASVGAAATALLRLRRRLAGPKG